MNRELILKLRNGYAISRKDYNTAKEEYEAALANASEDQKAQALAYLQSVTNKQSADPRSNKHARHTGAEAYRIATTMLNGTFDPAAVASPLNTDSGIDTRRKDYGRARNIAVDFYLKNNVEKAKNDLIQSSNQASSKGRYAFDATRGIDNLSTPLGATRGSLVKSYAEKLYQNIQDAKNEETNNGKIVYGKVDHMYDDLDLLTPIIEGKVDKESDAAYNTLLDIASKYDTTEHWNRYFGNTIPVASDNENLNKLTAEGYIESELDDYTKQALGKRNLKLFKNRVTGKYKIVNSDYSDYNSGAFADYNDDWTIGNTDEERNLKGYDKGIVVDDIGDVYYGNMGGLDRNSSFYKLYLKTYNDRLNSIKNTIKPFFYDYRLSDTDDEFIRSVVDKVGKSFNAADVSALFNGERVIAISPDRQPVFNDNNFIFRPGIKFYTKDLSGNIVEKTFADIRSKYDRNADDENIIPNYEVYNYTDQIESFPAGLMNKDTSNEYLIILTKMINDEQLSKTESDKITEFLKDDLKQLQFIKNYYNKSWTDLDLMNAFRIFLLNYFRKKRGLMKNGGNILFAKQGTEVNTTKSIKKINRFQDYQNFENLRREQEARNKGYKNYKEQQYKEANPLTEGITASDRWRLASLAQDVASIATSLLPGIGTVSSAGLGVTSTITNAIADFKDPTISTGDALKNIGINLGFAGLGMIPGAKMNKVGRSLVKWLPRIVAAYGTHEIFGDPKHRMSIQKVLDGNIKNLSREDWENLSHVMSVAAGFARGARYTFDKKVKVNKLITKESKIKLKNLENSDKTFTKEQITKVNEELSLIKKGKDAEKKAVLILQKNLGLNKEEANLVLNKPVVGRLGDFSISDKEIETLDANSYENIRNLWNNENKIIEESSPVTRWIGRNLGGGEYTSTQRAILNSNILNEADRMKLIDHQTYNPLINWGGIRDGTKNFKDGGKINYQKLRKHE